jgi:hypothetical protein
MRPTNLYVRDFKELQDAIESKRIILSENTGEFELHAKILHIDFERIIHQESNETKQATPSH